MKNTQIHRYPRQKSILVSLVGFLLTLTSCGKNSSTYENSEHENINPIKITVTEKIVQSVGCKFMEEQSHWQLICEEEEDPYLSYKQYVAVSDFYDEVNKTLETKNKKTNKFSTSESNESFLDEFVLIMKMQQSLKYLMFFDSPIALQGKNIGRTKKKYLDSTNLSDEIWNSMKRIYQDTGVQFKYLDGQVQMVKAPRTLNDSGKSLILRILNRFKEGDLEFETKELGPANALKNSFLLALEEYIEKVNQ